MKARIVRMSMCMYASFEYSFRICVSKCNMQVSGMHVLNSHTYRHTLTHTHPQHNTLCSTSSAHSFPILTYSLRPSLSLASPLPAAATQGQRRGTSVLRGRHILMLFWSSSIVFYIWFDLTLCFSAGTECARQPAHLVSTVLLTQL